MYNVDLVDFIKANGEGLVPHCSVHKRTEKHPYHATESAENVHYAAENRRSSNTSSGGFGTLKFHGLSSGKHGKSDENG